MIIKDKVDLQFLKEVGINPFAVKLLTESFNKVAEATPEGVSFIFNDIRITLVKETLNR